MEKASYKRECLDKLFYCRNVWEGLHVIMIDLNMWSSYDFKKKTGYEASEYKYILKKTPSKTDLTREKLTAYCVALGLSWSVSEKLFTMAGLCLDSFNPEHWPFQTALEEYSKYYFHIRLKGVFPDITTKALIIKIMNDHSVLNSTNN